MAAGFWVKRYVEDFPTRFERAFHSRNLDILLN